MTTIDQIVGRMPKAAHRASDKPVATVRVTNGGYAMTLSTYVAYALPEGKHELFARPIAPADERAAFEASADGAEAAREYLVRYLRAAVGNDTFTQYIRAELAGDFALAIANAHADHSEVRND
ncbi:hypothetical protein WL67_15965 [Burkholderia ubonensis]|uniref:hypothetical protein n=1 Tax=Burkholderia ubonensis TaxID=101571 RepID=UPI00075296AA|nr:hypothetical protein [Burkholderia ubonensis]KWD53407.1 hypothetical protein WL67_15965 [Burkholderia ubonensis]KWD68414.1 hypothetical protein WL66_23485 [Burkholderia ubonensis]